MSTDTPLKHLLTKFKLAYSRSRNHYADEIYDWVVKETEKAYQVEESYTEEDIKKAWCQAITNLTVDVNDNPNSFKVMSFDSFLKSLKKHPVDTKLKKENIFYTNAGSSAELIALEGLNDVSF